MPHKNYKNTLRYSKGLSLPAEYAHDSLLTTITTSKPHPLVYRVRLSKPTKSLRRIPYVQNVQV